MKKFISVFVSACILSAVLSMPLAMAEEDALNAEAPKSNSEVKLTDAQKNELKQLTEKMFEIKKQMIHKYLEYGIITKEQAEKKIERLEKMKKMKEQNGYLPKKWKPWHKKKFKWDED